ncbi:Tim44/TimA family putative adaptor protein [Albirhodobacter sp. R86504]|uniref:Tim44/TimA family putative adaptor protein n=1 Tax=Albirhodobacter sp. R86504 TaxID=3093848 RepID=UPI0036713EFC
MDDSVIQVLVLAAIAVFLVLRLKSILGTREGYEKPLIEDEPEAKRSNRSFEVIDGGPDHDIIDNLPEGSTALEPLSAMKRVEPEFSVTKFLSGARGAYEMILVAFDKGEMERIRPFLAPEVFDAFNGVVEQRAANGLRVEGEFLGVRQLVLSDAQFDRSTNEAEITVRFTGEMVTAVRNADGEIVEGDPKVSRKQRDSWTFSRVMGANDPNWRLVATGD